jgi:hypothetical protein
VKLLACITDYKDTVIAESGGQQPAGFALVPEKVQVIRVEFLQQLLREGIELAKVNKLCPWLERYMGVPLLDYVLRAVLTNSPNSCPQSQFNR